jgi:soluble lytic murein transglycosylase-like protein
VLANPDYGKFAAPYLPLIEKAAAASGVPAALLAALGGQESHFKNFEGTDLGGGMGRAQGPFQVVPYWHPDAPNYKTDMYGHILYAANYLKSLYDQEGSWKGAMRRYNGGYRDDEYQDPVLKNAYSYGMSTLLSDRGFMRPTFAQLA